ncbi:MAG: hypothetical protein HY697_04385 [Deltaproteobacteria bacterium]|nr:hypothetical protein [Deltaproteobacteria bacterium]
MEKIERLRAALAGREVDRPPFAIWYHFGTQHAPPERTAEAHLEFFQVYDLDLLKVMNDYEYPMPKGLEAMASPAELTRLALFREIPPPMANQLKVVEIISGALRGQALFVDTVFNAWSTLRRNLAKEAMPRLMADFPEELEAALGIVNGNLIRYALASLERGAAGIFLSVPATAETVTEEQYGRFMRPFDLELLQAIDGRGELNILHAHGARVYFDRLLDYPVQALSWADRNGGPSISQARRKIPLTLMAGLDHEKFPNWSIRAIRDQAAEALAQAGRTKFILAPGCSVPTYTFPSLIRAARQAAGK